MLILAQWPTWLVGVLTVGVLFFSVLLVLTVLIQKPQGGGLAGAFGGGGAGSGQTAFGAKTGDALTVLTIIVFSIFLLFTIGMNLGIRSAHRAEVTPGSRATSSDTTLPAQQPAPSSETPASSPPNTPTPATTPAPSQPQSDPNPGR